MPPTVLTRRCNHHGGDVPAHEVFQIAQENNVCFPCVLAFFTICSECSRTVGRGHARRHQGQNYCHSCADSRFRTCMYDEQSYPLSQMSHDGHVHVANQHMHLFVTCSMSGRFVLLEDAVRHNGNWYHPQHVPLRHKIHRFNHKPEPIFHGSDDANNLYFGVELEIEGGGEDNNKCDQLLNLVNAADKPPDWLVYGKHDGSIQNGGGFELVTHPASFQTQMEIPWGELMEKAFALGFSKDPDTCGLHVHMSRRYFGQSEVRQDMGIMKLLYLVEKFWDKILRFSRRNQAQVDRWASRYGMQSTPKELLDFAKSGQGRYKAVNLENQYTVEIRLFRGTLDAEVLRATIQFCNLLATLSKTKSVQEIMGMTWDELCKAGSEYSELGRYLATRRIGHSTPAETPVMTGMNGYIFGA
jgi:hypothetical protein